MSRAFIALGSNLEQPQQQVLAALAALDTVPGVRLLRASSLYRTAPVGYLDQPDFINAVAELDTDLAPLALLDALMQLEERFGRVRSFRNAPRVLDLDLLMMEGVELESERLTLPHPRMHERAFVLAPLAELQPDLAVGRHGRADQLLAGLEASGVERLAG
ncbi:2-amino-4-hydroxy-6-hydroxymethyldihydropteridine diphosphokinase [Pseudogulbenkiania sp. MAI-1]|uniref:2-amino-4-hydroxy-6- hydroxymethyldihydropteridine diphosphokinase n=1 Tax=Pseudogulbenkiania sp. MAI-1 TaxID=990370 RepID=UPI00045EB0AF